MDILQDEGRASLLSLSQALRLHFAEAGFPCSDERPCTPHLPIAKRLQRPFSNQLKQKQWPPQCEEVTAVCVHLWGQSAQLLRSLWLMAGFIVVCRAAA